MTDKSPNLEVRFRELDAIETAVTVASRGITGDLHSLLEQVNVIIAGWSPSSASRQAHDEYQRKLLVSVDKLGAALDKVGQAVRSIEEAARDAEVRNVALLR